MQTIVEDVLPDHTLYDAPKGFETLRQTSIVIVDRSDFHYWRWSGTQWVDLGAIPVNDIFYVTRLQKIYQYMGGDQLLLLFNVGDTTSRPPLVVFPPFGTGLTWGTQSYGQLPNASTDYPDAYQVMQHPGDTV